MIAQYRYEGEVNWPRIVKLLKLLSVHSADTPIRLEIASGGGDTAASITAFNALRKYRQLETCTAEHVASAAVMLFLAGRVRWICESDRLYVHDPSIGATGRQAWSQLTSGLALIGHHRTALGRSYADTVPGLDYESAIELIREGRGWVGVDAVSAGFAHSLADEFLDPTRGVTVV